eukprot:5533611-Amphidinium_carterae.1
MTRGSSILRNRTTNGLLQLTRRNIMFNRKGFWGTETALGNDPSCPDSWEYPALSSKKLWTPLFDDEAWRAGAQSFEASSRLGSLQNAKQRRHL